MSLLYHLLDFFANYLVPVFHPTPYSVLNLIMKRTFEISSLKIFGLELVTRAYLQFLEPKI